MMCINSKEIANVLDKVLPNMKAVSSGQNSGENEVD
jgi:hypothetical protein